MKLHHKVLIHRLNPCFSGGWSSGCINLYWKHVTMKCLNPCFSGGWSSGIGKSRRTLIVFPVLILVLVEDGLVAEKEIIAYRDSLVVLILVLVEDGLVELLK